MIHWTHPLSQLAMIIEMECCIFAYYKARQRQPKKKFSMLQYCGNFSRNCKWIESFSCRFSFTFPLMFYVHSHSWCNQYALFSLNHLSLQNSATCSWPVNALTMFTFWTYFTHNFQWSSYHFTSLSYDCVINALIERIRAI